MVLTFVDIEMIIDRLWKGLVGFNVLFLLLLIPFGNDSGTGNKSWINIPLIPFNVQPAEVVKLSFVLLLAVQFYLLQDHGVSRPSSSPRRRGTPCSCAASSPQSRATWAWCWSIFSSLSSWPTRRASSCAGSPWARAATGGLSYLAWPHLPEYIKMRFLVVLDHSLDPLDKGFHQARSILAIGSGQLTGQGYLNGTQTQSAASSALPARHTDFIFAVAARSWGFWAASPFC
jgi:rod shape determining protein RodA